MTVHGLRMQVEGGEGLVVAGPVAALFVADDGADPAAYEFVSALADAVRAEPAGSDASGPALVRTVGALVAGVMSRGGATRPFALVAEAGGGVAVMIVGPVTVRYTRADGAQEALSGRDAAMWVDRIIHGTPAAISVATDGGGAPSGHPLADLVHGSVGGGGFALLSRDASVPDVLGPAPVGAADDEQGDDQVWSTSGPAPAGAGREPAWVPGGMPDVVPEPGFPRSQPVSPWSQPESPRHSAVESEPAAESEPLQEAPVESEPAQDASVEQEPAPPPGPPVLQRPDGTNLEVGRMLVLGREPQISPLVASGEAEAMTLEDEARVTSRVHASVAADGDALTVTDLGSANGTWILQQGDSDWTELTANEPTVLRPGGRIRIGSEEFVLGSSG